jgi:hypothetical protein
MSIEVEVRFPSARLPSPQVWQDSISDNNFAVDIDCDFDPVTFTGFLPARYRGKPAGFEYYYECESVEQSCVSLRWAGRAHEAVSGLIAAACLCHLTAGQLMDTEAGETLEPGSVIAWARQHETDFQQMIADENQEPIVAEQPTIKRWWRFW